MTIIYLLVLVIGLRPVKVDTKYEFSTKNLDVLFVIDTTISMWARDYNGYNPRMVGVKEDVNAILNELAGSNFGLVTFDNSSHVLAPFTQDLKHISNLVDILAVPDSFDASGTNMVVPYMDIDGLLQSSNKKENRKTIVFYISDGEITTEEGKTSYAELSKYIDSGAVLGYGSENGGKMKEGYDYIYDPETHKDALSKIDEENLKQIAEDLGVQYLNMNGGNAGLKGLIEIIKEQSTTIVEQGDGAEKYIDTYYIFAALLAAMLMIEGLVYIRKGRL
ncbi:vWA domain-containing protein [Butyrivibrio sp. YAB3001]|uniref:vWA domain-containing protein n=1 Tax=Butyrivibrio sp. YAB3001 TaxID=1520812 RepID=UPI0015882550|nr:VWA domain-containing protein [Butyrivibrio sp. YAB3001]